MTYSYVTINGQRVQTAVAAAFEKMRAAFKAEFGLDLLVSSGTRTRAEQEKLYRAWVNREPGASLAAAPGRSNHEEGGPRGPRALDLRDSGRDLGVTRIGTVRSNWLAANAPKYGFTPAGHFFNPREGWHYEYTGSLGGGGTASRWNLTSRSTKAIQKVVGAKQDGIHGPETDSKIRAFQKRHGLTVDGIWGPASDAKGFPPAPQPAPQPEQPVGKVGKNYTSRPVKDIQRAVGVPEANRDGIYGEETTRYVGEWQTGVGIDPDGDWGITSDGLAFPPAGSVHGVDYSFARPAPAMMQKRGIKLAGRYLWNTKYDDGRTNKGIGLEELGALNTAGIEVFYIYEEDGKELRGGFDAGVRVARAADAFLKGLGKSGHPIYFNVDYDAQAGDLPAILDALDGVASVIGRERTGLYAGYGPIKAAFDAGKITWGFQTYAWSGDKWDPRAHLQQWSNGQWGGTIDFTRAVAAEYGQNPPKPAPRPNSKGGTLKGLSWTGVQRMLKSDFGYKGAIDNIPGKGSIAAFQRFMNSAGYGRLTVDGIDGTATLKAAQTWLKKRWGYKGAIDGIRGAGTNAAWARAEAANGRAYARVK